MRSALILLFVVALFAAAVHAQSVGCCCDPLVRNGSFSTQVSCDAKGFVFVGVPTDLTVTCGVFCNATLQAPVRCGDGVCQLSESSASCPGDCAAQTSCGNPNFRPAPNSLAAVPVEGKKAVRLDFAISCPSSYVSIERCEGVGCADFLLVAQIPSSPFVDEDSSLEFNRDYTYRITAYDRVFGASEPAFVQANLGDLECLENPRRTFCVSSIFYNRFEGYLTESGYGLASPLEFAFDFEGTVGRTFATRLNHPWQCDTRNRLVAPIGQSKCASGQVCVADEAGARCVVPQDCAQGSPFGLLATKSSCESGRYCFFDKAGSSVDSCLGCDASMRCNDYKTKGACETDNCGAGVCQWKPLASDLGTGVCVDTGRSNCASCPPGERESPLWDVCSEEKSAGLSTFQYPCFFDKDQKLSKGCSEASCSDYTQLQCGSPAQGIRLSGNNSLVVPSADPCNIRVCEYHETTGCVKNADGTSGASFQDCRFGNQTCELDYFPPITTLIPNGTAGKIEFLNFNVFDKENSGGALRDRAGRSGYTTYLCVKSPQSLCREASSFIPVSSARLVLSNRLLKEGNRTIAQFASGNNVVAFYSRDPANNVEVVKEATVFACDNCNGPIVLDLSITQGRAFGTRLFTASTQPVFTFTFDGPTTISYVELKNSVRSVPLQQLTNGSRTVHSFSAVGLDGVYDLYINAFNNRSIYMDARAVHFELVVNTSAIQVSLTPKEGDILPPGTGLSVLLNFSGLVTLRDVLLVEESFSDPFVKKWISRSILSSFKATDNHTFSTVVANVSGGSFALVVDAQGFNSIPVRAQSKFFIASQKPKMRLVEPAFGVTSLSRFNITVETPLPSQCAYVYDTPSPPNSTDFMFFNKLSGAGTLHSAQGLSIPFGDEFGKKLHVYCDYEQFGICAPDCQRSFNISFDAEPPYILNAFAEPGIISERFIPETELYLTSLKVLLDKPGMCKYSRSTDVFESMEGFFPGFDVLPKESLAVEVNVSAVQNYSFFVACKGKNQLVGDSRRISFAVDLSRNLTVASSTPRGFPTTNFSIGVVANKRVVCYFGKSVDDITECMGTCKTGYGHNHDVLVTGEDEYNYFVRCIHPTGAQSEVVPISVFVDTSPPLMEYVTDESTLPSDRNVSWSLARVRVSFKASDEQSGISHYLVSIQNQRTRQFVVRDKEVAVFDGEPFYVDLENASLMDGEPYVVIARAVNNVGLRSEPLSSDGVSVDASQTPPACFDGELSSGEVDIDCGGSCDSCGEGSKCLTQFDCDTNHCVENTCQIASCTDGAINGVESDIDCGGKYGCSRCADNLACKVDADCASDYCNPLQKKCAPAPACADKQLSIGESDVDCGGSCDGCDEGKSCQESSDCAQGLNCASQLCSSVPLGDEDSDGVSDGVDKCVETPLGESVDDKGCAPSQVSSKGDKITDKWRVDYFGCIECDEAAADNDADADGLTNLQEFSESTDPTDEDSDGDGWSDGDELESGTDPTNPASHPSSAIGVVLWVVFALLAIGGTVYGGYLLKEARSPEHKVPPSAPPLQHSAPPSSKLHSFAKKEEAPDTEWVAVDQLKSYQPPKEPPKVESPKDPNPLNRLKGVSKRLSPDEQEALRERESLPKKDHDALFEKLKITARADREKKRKNG